jgi:hypothetical protein
MKKPVHQVVTKSPRFKPLKASILWMLFWPLLFGALIAMLWLTLKVKTDEDRALLEQNIRQEAQSITDGYAHFLKRSIEQMDQVTMQLQYNWEASNGALDLKDMVRRGLFTAPHFVMVAIYDQHGT